jgi:hypothetical protein
MPRKKRIEWLMRSTETSVVSLVLASINAHKKARVTDAGR